MPHRPLSFQILISRSGAKTGAFECALDALNHGWDDPIIRKMVSGEDAGEDAQGLESRDLYETRLRVLEELWDNALDAAEKCHGAGVLEAALRAAMPHIPERVIAIASGQAE